MHVLLSPGGHAGATMSAVLSSLLLSAMTPVTVPYHTPQQVLAPREHSLHVTFFNLMRFLLCLTAESAGRLAKRIRTPTETLTTVLNTVWCIMSTACARSMSLQ
jgi:hypothetical protein